MQLTEGQGKVLEWIAARQPVIGMFHVMTDIKPMIACGLVEQKPVMPSKRQLLITESGKEILSRKNVA